METQPTNSKKFGTFAGVFTPTLLTILGVIMYLRMGWAVGNAGLLGAWLLIIISFLITLTTVPLCQQLQRIFEEVRVVLTL